MASERRSFPSNDKPELRPDHFEMQTPEMRTAIRKYIEENPEEIENIRTLKKGDDTKQRTLDGWLRKSSNKSKETTKTTAVESSVNNRRSTDCFLHEIPEPSASTFADPLHIALQQCVSPEMQYLDSVELTPDQRKSNREVICVVNPQSVSDSDLQQAFIDERREVTNENNSLEIKNDISIVYHEPNRHDIVVQNESLSEPVLNVSALNTISNLECLAFFDDCGNVQSSYIIPSNLFFVSDSNISKNNPHPGDGQNSTFSNLNNLNLDYPGVEPLLSVDGNLSLMSECTENIPEVKDIVFTDSASRTGNDSEEQHDSHLKELPLSSKKSDFTSEESCMEKLVSMLNENTVHNECNVENQKLNLIQHSELSIDRPTNTSPKLPGENAATIDLMGREVLIIQQNDMNFEIGGNEEFSLIETGTSDIKIEHVRTPKKKNIKEKNSPNKNLSDQVPGGTEMRRKLRQRSGTKLQSYLQSLSTRRKCRSEKKIQVLSNESQSSDILDHCSSPHSDLNENSNCDDSDTDCYYTDAIGSEAHSTKEKVKPNSIKMTGTVELEGRNTRSGKHLNRQSTDKSNDFSTLSELDLKVKDSPCSTVCSSTNDEINNVKISKEKDSSTSYNLRRRKLSSSSIIPLKKMKQTKRSESRDSFAKEMNCDEQSSELQNKFCDSPEEKGAKVLTRRNSEKVVVSYASPSKQTEVAEFMQIENSVEGSVQHSKNSPKSNKQVSPTSPKRILPKRHASTSCLVPEAKTSNGIKCLKETDSICTAVSKNSKCNAEEEKKDVEKTPNLVCDTSETACDKKDVAEDMISNMVDETSCLELAVVEKQRVSTGKHDSPQELVTQPSSSKTNDKSDFLNESQSAGDRDSFDECTDSVVCKKIDGFDTSANENQVNRQKETTSFDEVEGSSASKYMDNSKLQETQRHHLAVKEEDVNVETLKNTFMKQLFLSDSSMELVDDVSPSCSPIKCRKSKRIKRCTSSEVGASNLKHGEGSGSVSSTTEISPNSRIIRRTKSDPSKFGNQQTNVPILKSSSPKKLSKTCLKPKRDKDETSVLSGPRSSKSHIGETSSSLEKKRVKSSKTHRKKPISKQSNKTKDSMVIEKQKAVVNVSCDTSKLSSDMHSSLSLPLDKSNTESICSALNDPPVSSQEHTVDPSAEPGTSAIEGNDKPLNALEVKLGNTDCQSTKSTELPCEKLHNGTESSLMRKLTSLNLGNDVNMELVDERVIDFILKEVVHFRRWEGTEKMEAFWKQVQANPKGKVRLIPSAEMPNPENGPGLHLYCGVDPED